MGRSTALLGLPNEGYQGNKKENLQVRQVMISLCCVCKGDAINCYDSEREPQRRYCDECNDEVCPLPTDHYSTGFCKKHLKEQMDRIEQRRKK